MPSELRNLNCFINKASYGSRNRLVRTIFPFEQPKCYKWQNFASREGNWLLHLDAIKELIPWCFAYDKINYARYLPVYYAQMTGLSTNHPDIFDNFMQGKFSVQLSSTNTFGKIPVDQTIETTVNKDTQTPGGTTRFSLNKMAV